MQSHSSERLIKCLKFEKTFKSSTGFSDHNALKHPQNNPFVCKLCNKIFSWSGLTFHMMAHRGEKPQICETLGHHPPWLGVQRAQAGLRPNPHVSWPLATTILRCAVGSVEMGENF